MAESQPTIRVTNEKNYAYSRAVFELLHTIDKPEKYAGKDYQESFILEFYLEGDAAIFYNQPKPVSIILTNKLEEVSIALVPEVEFSNESYKSAVRKTFITLKCSDGGLAIFGLGLTDRITFDSLRFERILSKTRSK